MEVRRRPFDPSIYHGRSVNACLTLIGRARRSIERIRRAGGPPHRQPCLVVEIPPSTLIEAFSTHWKHWSQEELQIHGRP
jgi:hypothetical protein